MSRLTIDARALSPGVLVPPHSKSDAQRALTLAHAAGRPEAFRVDVGDEQLPRDTRVLARGLEALRGAGSEPVEIDCEDGGAPFRFLLAQAAVTPGARVRFTGSLRLAERPHLPLVDALLDALGPSGLRVEVGTPWPVTVEAPPEPRARAFRVGLALSSQYASSLLLAAAALHRRCGEGVAVEWVGQMPSAGYLELTAQWLERAGFTLSRAPSRIEVQAYSAAEAFPPVPGDWSAIGYLLIAAWRSGGSVTGVDAQATHPDRAILRELGELGLRVEIEDGVARVSGEPRGGLRASGRECPDLLPTLAALACALPEPSALTEVSILRSKESDRVQGIAALVQAAGGQVALEDDFAVIGPPARIAEELEFDSRGDHRMCMAAATLAILGGSRLTLDGAEHVAKSFPAFWSELLKIGVRYGFTPRSDP